MRHIHEEQLALYAWGDLPSQESSTVAAHLQDCGSCRNTLSEFQEARSFVTASLQNPEANELSEVRTNFMARSRPQQIRVRPWAWWAAGAAAALTLLTLPRAVEHRPSVTSTVKPSMLTENIDPGPPLQIPLTPVTASRPKRMRFPKAGIRSVTLISQADREPVIKMTTADPNVVILWQLTERTEQQP